MTLTSIGDSGEIKLTALKIAQIYGSIFAETPLLKPILKGETPEIFSPFPYSEKLRWTIKKALQITVREGTLKNILKVFSEINKICFPCKIFLSFNK